jgi:hypothetical protein
MCGVFTAVVLKIWVFLPMTCHWMSTVTVLIWLTFIYSIFKLVSTNSPQGICRRIESCSIPFCNSLLSEISQLTAWHARSPKFIPLVKETTPARKIHVTISLEQMNNCAQLATVVKQENSNLIWKRGVSDLYPCSYRQVHSLPSLLDCQSAIWTTDPGQLQYFHCFKGSNAFIIRVSELKSFFLDCLTLKAKALPSFRMSHTTWLMTQHHVHKICVFSSTAVRFCVSLL